MCPYRCRSVACEYTVGLQICARLHRTLQEKEECQCPTIFGIIERITKKKKKCEQSCELIRHLVEERRQQGMTQQDVADITGILPSNLARLESGKRVPTLVVLQKYASALGKHIELKLCDGAEE